ncbi:solute carrier family 35, member C2 [Nematocida homosporus]|uniref:solute carrier family 35, member C2 n=1 Tax=Nematocida homosporus TaxID=1912981 RepID=UPI0022208FEA|nr:solute carrier family 35, member C2 [Nematocida homosporus]KAI5186613.1 solute carrier family 35, member C2 [Nematocida homosporus]
MNFFSSFLLSKDDYDFRFPLFLGSISHLIHFGLSVIGIVMFRSPPCEQTLHSPIPYLIRKKIGSPIDKTPSLSRKRTQAPVSQIWRQPDEQESGRTFRILQICYAFLLNIGAFDAWIITCALCGSIDNGFSGYALRSVPLAFYTMLKSSSPIFILISRFLFQLEEPSMPLIGTICIIATGVFFASKSDTVVYRFQPICMILSSCVMGGFRGAFLEYFIKQNITRHNNILYNLCVVSLLMGIFLCTGFFLFEGVHNLLQLKAFATLSSTLNCLFLIFGSSVVSFFLCVTEYTLISKTSVITLSVIGIVKELIIIAISVCQGKIHLSVANMCGLCTASVGVLLFSCRHLFTTGNPLMPPPLLQADTSAAEKTPIEYNSSSTTTADLSTISQPA